MAVFIQLPGNGVNGSERETPMPSEILVSMMVSVSVLEHASGIPFACVGETPQMIDLGQREAGLESKGDPCGHALSLRKDNFCNPSVLLQRV